MKGRNKELLYQKIAGNLEKQITNEVLKTGDKLPSVRMLCQEHGVSMSTVLQAYYQLEGKNLIESRPQSGYYVSYAPKQFAAIPKASKPAPILVPESTNQLISKVYNTFFDENTTMFSISVPDEKFLPIAKLNKELIRAMRTLPAGGTGYAEVQGNEKLRKQIAHRAYTWDGKLTEEEIVTTAGCMNAITFCITSLTNKGDTIAVESPVYFGVLQLAQSLGLKVLELPTHPQTGIEIEALKSAITKKKIKVVLLVSNFNNPLGSCMPAEHKQAVVKLLEKHNIPLIEDDLYGDMYYGDSRPKSCKTYDESGLVLWCGSVSKTLAPGYRVGWVAPGKFKSEIIQAKLFQSVSSNTLMQETIANFLEAGRYEHHMRKLRHIYHMNCLQYIGAISKYFPEGTKISRPQGGFVLWVELDSRIDTVELYEQAIQRKIKIAPGRMFTLHQQFNNCMRLSYGLPWTEKLDSELRTLGSLAKKMLI